MSTPRLKQLYAQLQQLANPEKQAVFKRFFKTGAGQYGENDQFLGLTVPQQRAVAKPYRDLSRDEINTLLHSPLHECRFIALITLTDQFRKTKTDKKTIVDFYLDHSSCVNNWDLVDVSSYNILGAYLVTHEPTARVLYDLAHSHNLWERRIAMVATYAFIRTGTLDHTFAIAKLLLADTHDLIHKATGWMLREAGEQNEAALKKFLDMYATIMPRTALRYSIEKFSEEVRRHYLHMPPSMLAHKAKHP